MGEHEQQINLGGIETNTVDDPIFENISVTLFFQGCDRRCDGCHNPQFQDKSIELFTPLDFVFDFIDMRMDIAGSLIFCGGEPMLQQDVLQTIASKYYGRMKNILYTGLSAHHIPFDVYRYLDAIVDGPYVKELKGTFPASTNQMVYIKNEYGNFFPWSKT